MILLIDNYDSFSYNLYQLVGSIEPDIRVIRNDEMTALDVKQLNPEGIILSPGPGRPEKAGICINVVQQLGEKIPILGVCLGHQAICTAFGAHVTYAKRLMHGKQSKVHFETACPIFKNVPKIAPAARYHSLIVPKEGMPESLKIIALAEDGEVMGVQHNEYPVFGLQFHPESILTPDGKTIITNFVKGVCCHD